MKLYWRVKINGKWNWRPVHILYEHRTEDEIELTVLVQEFEGGEEDGR